MIVIPHLCRRQLGATHTGHKRKLRLYRSFSYGLFGTFITAPVPDYTTLFWPLDSALMAPLRNLIIAPLTTPIHIHQILGTPDLIWFTILTLSKHDNSTQQKNEQTYIWYINTNMLVHCTFKSWDNAPLWPQYVLAYAHTHTHTHTQKP